MVMSTAAVVAQPVVAKTSFLQHVGNFFKRILHIGIVAAEVAEPLVAAEFPDIAPLYQSAIGLAVSEEATATAATGTGATKLANVVAKGWPQAQAFFAANGITVDQAAYEKWVSAVVDTLNLLPAPAAVADASAVAATK